MNSGTFCLRGDGSCVHPAWFYSQIHGYTSGIGMGALLQVCSIEWLMDNLVSSGLTAPFPFTAPYVIKSHKLGTLNNKASHSFLQFSLISYNKG